MCKCVRTTSMNVQLFIWRGAARPVAASQKRPKQPSDSGQQHAALQLLPLCCAAAAAAAGLTGCPAGPTTAIMYVYHHIRFILIYICGCINERCGRGVVASQQNEHIATNFLEYMKLCRATQTYVHFFVENLYEISWHSFAFAILCNIFAYY